MAPLIHGERPKVWREMRAIARQGWLMASRRATSTAGEGGELTVFVHGYFAGSSVFGPMADALHAHGVARRASHFGYGPVSSIDRLARRLAEQIHALAPHTAVNIVAHSLGGLVARYYAQILGGRVDRLVLLAAPHAGTERARPWRALPLTGEMAPGSTTLRKLHETRHLLHGKVVCSIVARADGLVEPASSAALSEHDVVVVDDVGHQSMLFDARVVEITAKALQRSVPAGVSAQRVAV